MVKRNTVLIIGISLFLGLGLGQAKPQKNDLPGKVVLTHKEGGLVSDKSFQCDGTIHAYLTFPKPVQKGELQGTWTLPNKAVVENTIVNLDFDPPGRRTAYLYLSFEGERGGVLGSRDKHIEKEPAYNGIWNLKVLLDKKPMANKDFDVDCQPD